MFGPLTIFAPLAKPKRGLRLAMMAAPLAVPVGLLGAPALSQTAESADTPAPQVVFHACQPSRGCELWTTDGTREGTQILRNIAVGGVASNPQNLTALGDGRVVFSAHQPPNHTGFDYQPWITDGTRAGTRLIRRTSTLAIEMPPQNFTPLGNGRAVYVARGNGQANTQLTLWATGGARVGTRPILALNHWPSLFVPLGNGRALFRYQDANGVEMWVTDGTPRGTRLLRDIYPGEASSNPNAAVSLGDGRALFNAADGVHGRELWVSDGRPAGTRMVADLSPGAASSDPQMLTAIGGGRAMFTAAMHGIGRRIWVTDGTAAGTQMLTAALNPVFMTHMGDGRVLFSAYTSQYGTELWITDGTDAGTRLVRDITPDGGSSLRDALSLGDGRALFWNLVNGPHELWVTDGTRRGTTRIGDAGTLHSNSFGPHTQLALGDGRALFIRQDHRGVEPWITDGTRRGTRILRDINRAAGQSHSRPRGFTLVGQTPDADQD